MDISPEIWGLLSGAVLSLVVRIISNRRVAACRAEVDAIEADLDDLRRENLRLAKERFGRRRILADAGIDDPFSTPPPDTISAVHHPVDEEPDL